MREIVNNEVLAKPESIYRTRWLMAHNRLHDLVHKEELLSPEARAQQFREYLAELSRSNEIASSPA